MRFGPRVEAIFRSNFTWRWQWIREHVDERSILCPCCRLFVFTLSSRSQEQDILSSFDAIWSWPRFDLESHGQTAVSYSRGLCKPFCAQFPRLLHRTPLNLFALYHYATHSEVARIVAFHFLLRSGHQGIGRRIRIVPSKSPRARTLLYSLVVPTGRFLPTPQPPFRALGVRARLGWFCVLQ